MIKTEENKNDFRKLGNTESIGNSESIGKSDRIGNNDRIGKSDNIGKSCLDFKRIRGRREFMDLILDYIRKQKERIMFSKLNAYFQYTTGSSEAMIKQAVAVLENIDLIESKEIFFEGGYDYFYKVK